MTPILGAEEGGELFIPPGAASSTDTLLVLLVLGLPLAGFLLTGLVGRRLSRPWIISVAAVVAATLVATYLAFQSLSGAYGEHGIGDTLFSWIAVGDLEVEFGYVVDNLSALMLIVVTWIGALVHIYSIGYMAHDPGKWRFFAYLNLFMFSMLLLVLASSYLVVFAAWELVGLSSYLLIGFWYTRRAPALASKKAFLVNRVADQSFLVGIMAVFLLTGTMDFFDSFVEWNLLEIDPLDPQHGGPAAVHRRGRQERPVPLPCLAAGRDGGSHPRLRPHPRRHHGQCRGVLHRSHHAHLRHGTGDDAAGGGHRHLHGRAGGDHRGDPEGHQTGAGLLDPEPAGLHVHGPRRGGLAGRHLPPGRPWFHQGPPLPGLGLGHPCGARRAGHDQDGRPVAEDPVDPLDLPHRRAVAGRHPPVRGLLLQGCRAGRGGRAGLVAALRDRRHGGRSDRLLHVPPDGPDLLRPQPRRPGGGAQDPRVATVDGAPAGAAGRSPPSCSAWPSAAAWETRPSSTGWSRSSTRPKSIAGISFPEYELLGIDGGLHPHLRGHGRPRHRRGHLVVRRVRHEGPPSRPWTAWPDATA